MSKTLKNVIQWTLFATIILLVVFMVFVPIVFEIFFPDSPNIENIRSLTSNLGLVVGFLSVGLGLFSIYQANVGSKQVDKVLENVKEIAKTQDAMFSKLSEIRTSVVFSQKSGSAEDWYKDNVHE